MIWLGPHHEIIESVLKNSGTEHTVTLDSRKMTIALVIPSNEEHCEITREIIITRENDDGKFEVRFEETSADPVFVIQTDKRSFFADELDQQQWAGRLLYAHLVGKVKPYLIPPKEYVTQRDVINEQWISSADCVVELFNSSTSRADWRYRIVHKDGTVICRTLSPEKADGHTYHMLIDSVKEGFERGRKEGMYRAGEALSKTAFETVFSSSGQRFYQFPDEIRQLMEHGSIRKQIKKN
jgi:hypothetical protein